MKKRIANILDMGAKRFGAALLVLVLLGATFTSLATTQTEDSFHPTETMNEQGFLTSKEGVVHLTMIPTDYEYPQVVYFAGVPVVADEIIHKEVFQRQSGEYVEDWVHVTVPARDGETTMSGYTLYEHFVRQADYAEKPSYPVGTLAGDSVTGTVALYKDNGVTHEVLGVFANGTQVQIMGFTRTHYQVSIDGQWGFVPRELVQFTGEDEARVKAAEPGEYDSVNPGMEAAYERMNARYQALTDKYGDVNDWTIAMRAQWSQEQIEAGTLDPSPDVWVHLMPGEGDLTEEKARELADAVLTGEKLDPKAYLQVRSYYFVLNGERDKPTWQFTYRAGPDNTDWVVQLDRAGKPVELRSIENAGWPFPYGLDEMFAGKVVTPEADEITSKEAADIAWELFVNAWPEHGARESYEMTAALRAVERLNMRAWTISIDEVANKGEESEWRISYLVVLRSTNGSVIYNTEPDEYRDNITSFHEYARQAEMEKEKGPLFTWSLEDKAAFSPDVYAVPQEGQMTQEQAWEIAVKALKEQKGWTDDLLKDYTPYYFFCLPLYDLPLRWDIQVLTPAAVTEGNMDGFYVGIDADTGETLWVWGPGDSNG